MNEELELRMLLLKVYAALALVTLLALVITVAKIKVVEAIEGTPDPMVPTFKPLKQKTDTTIMYTGKCIKIKTHPNQDVYYYFILLVLTIIMFTGNGFMPEDWYFFHSNGRMSDRAYKSIRILDTLRWTGPTSKPEDVTRKF